MSPSPHALLLTSVTSHSEGDITDPHNRQSSSSIQTSFTPSHIHSHSHSLSHSFTNSFDPSSSCSLASSAPRNTHPNNPRRISTHLRPPSMSDPDSAAQHSRRETTATVASAGSPFNFQPQVLSASPVRANIGQRRGHRYKHSSVSAQHQIFEEPPQRAPPVLPASLPIPTFKEARDSMSPEQHLRLVWCLCHVAVAVFVFFESHGSMAMMALSHLVFFDAGSAAICVAVDVLGNFEVWRRSSIRHPFGLQRVEVLAGFAMSVFLLFGGFDLVSHNVKHFLENAGDHHPHVHIDLSEAPIEIAGINLEAVGIPSSAHRHSHSHVSTGTVDWATFAAIASTLVSAYGLRNHARIAKIMQVSYLRLPMLPSLLANPFHFLTLFFSALLLILPMLDFAYYTWLDGAICGAIAIAMFALGFRLAMAQGLMLLMSYGGVANGFFSNTNECSVPRVVREIETEPEVTKVEDAQFWQVHYGLGLANLKVRVTKGVDDQTLSKLRTRISNLVQNRLGEGYGQGSGLRWEVTMQTSVDMSINQ